MNLNNVTFTENLDGCMGVIIAHNLSLPHSTYTPLGKIWASVKRKVLEQYGVDVTGVFVYDDELRAVACSFCLNYGYLKIHGIDERIYTERFQDTFRLIASTFEDTIEAFLTDPENGAEAYATMVEFGATQDEIDELFNKFLRSINMRNDIDDVNSAKRKRRNAEFQQKRQKSSHITKKTRLS